MLPEIPIMPWRTILMLKNSKEGFLITIGNMFIELSKMNRVGNNYQVALKSNSFMVFFMQKKRSC
ncbi:hypothetical protein EFM31_00850 [Streptococcus thermophilus]|nr:hypothetical protein [Streptococcus thermophilus]